MAPVDTRAIEIGMSEIRSRAYCVLTDLTPGQQHRYLTS